jgi:GrpB-like predicted nucleotidyltransferase (UPF0157 family)
MGRTQGTKFAEAGWHCRSDQSATAESGDRSAPDRCVSRDDSRVAYVRIRRQGETEDLAIAAFEAHRREVAALLPTAEIEHVGATAVPGALTKGDVDLLVRVRERDFADAVVLLRGRYTVHQPHNWTGTLASFKAPGKSEPPVGVQVVVAGSDSDGFFGPFRDALINDPALLAEYNELKLRLDGLDYESYTERKGEFVERVLHQTNRRRG